MQHYVQRLHLVIWQLFQNSLKSNIIHFRNKRKPCTEVRFELNGAQLEIVHDSKYLGFYISEHLDILADSGSIALGGIIFKFEVFKNVSNISFTILYESTIVPILDYACEVWRCSKAPSNDNVQNRATRFFLRCPVPAFTGDMGWAHSFKECII